MWLIRKITDALQQVLPWMFGVVVIAGAYGYMSNEDYNDEFAVTFTFSCKTVLANTYEYPHIVVEECAKLASEMRAK